MSASPSVSPTRAVSPNPLPTIMLLTVASILLVLLGVLTVIGWILAPGVDVQQPEHAAQVARTIYVIAWVVPFAGIVAAAIVAFRRHRQHKESLLFASAALVLVLVGWAVSLVVPALALA